MYSSFQLATKYLQYYRKAGNSNGHGLHSPFVFDFVLNVLNNKSGYSVPTTVEALRKELLKDSRILHVDDFGAGSRTQAQKERTVSSIAKSAVKPKKYSHLLYRLVKYYKPGHILELGTSLGVTTAFLAEANPGASIITIEGSNEIAAIAKDNFKKLGLNNIEQVTGRFDDVLPDVLRNQETIDMVYIDGNHLYSPTINYFHQILEKVNDTSIIVFDDIHWSEEMERAWQEIKGHPAVKYSIDVFYLGFVFFNKDFKVKQDFIIRF